MDLLQLLGLVRRNWLALILAMLVGVAAGAGISYLQPNLYSATSNGYVVAGNSATVGDAYAGKMLASEKAETYLPLVPSRSVAEAVAKELGVESGEVSLEGANQGVIFTVTATASSPDLAREMADAGIRATSIAANDLETLTVSGESSGQTVVKIVPVELALTPTAPVSPNWTRNLALGLALGLLGGFGLVVLRRTLDRRIRQTSDVEELTGASALGIVPTAPELAKNISLAHDNGSAAEALRQLRTNLRFVKVDSPVRSIVVTSSNQGEGKSTLAMQLAGLLADAGEPTVIVDGDLRRPRVAKLFNIDGDLGLTQVVAGSLKLTDALVETSSPYLLALPAGRIPPNPSEIVGSKRMKTVIEHLAKTHMVIIDAPPLLPVTDAGLLAAVSDGALLVVQHGKTRKEQVALAARNLENVGATLLGFVMNKVSKQDMGASVYGYGYGGGISPYYYGEGKKRRKSDAGSSAESGPAPKYRPQRASLIEQTGENPIISEDTAASRGL